MSIPDKKSYAQYPAKNEELPGDKSQCLLHTIFLCKIFDAAGEVILVGDSANNVMASSRLTA
jgi:hypothetical protein